MGETDRLMCLELSVCMALSWPGKAHRERNLKGRLRCTRSSGEWEGFYVPHSTYTARERKRKREKKKRENNYRLGARPKPFFIGNTKLAIESTVSPFQEQRDMFFFQYRNVEFCRVRTSCQNFIRSRFNQAVC